MSAYDRDKLVELFGNDPATVSTVEREFFDTARDVAREIAATEALGAIARAAHRLKGASGMIGAAPLREVAEAVERAAKAHDLAGWGCRPSSTTRSCGSRIRRFACGDGRRAGLRSAKLALMIGPYRTR